MPLAAVLLPVFVLIALTFGLLFWMGASRRDALVSGETRLQDVALGQPAWPQRQTQISRAFQNQLELPVLFYVLVGLAIVTQKADLLFVCLSWAFVLSRLAHAYVHVTDNHVPRRFQTYLAGLAALMALWAIFAIRVIGGF